MMSIGIVLGLVTSGTTGSQFYIGSTAQGTANTTFTKPRADKSFVERVISGKSKVSVYARSRKQLYAYVGQLVIIES